MLISSHGTDQCWPAHVPKAGGWSPWAVEGDLDPAAMKSNVFKLEWPPTSGKVVEFPEVDRAEFFGLETAKKKISSGQAKFIAELEQLVEA